MLGILLPLTVLFSACGVGLPFWSMATLALLRGHMPGVRTQQPAMLAGFLLAGLMIALGLSAALGLSIAEHLGDHPMWPGVGSILGPAVLLGLLSPLTLIVPALLDRHCTSTVHALRAALDGWPRLSWDRRFVLWALPWCALLPVPILVGLDARPLPWAVACGISLAICGPLASLFLGASWLEVRADVVEASEEPGNIPRGTLVLGALTMMVSVAVGGALGAVLMTPVPMSHHDFSPPRGIEGLSPQVWRTVPLRIEGTAVEVRLDDTGVIIETDDGGGVGHVEPPYGSPLEFRVRTLDARAGTYRVVLRDYGRHWYVDIDSNGVRIDDGLGRRFAHHVGALGLALLLLLALGWLASVIAGVKLARAQTLGEIRTSTDHRSSDRRRVLEGTLRLAEGSSATVRKGMLVVTGSAAIEGAGLRVRIPDQMVQVRGAGELRDGSPIALVGTFQRLTSEGHRDATAPWPEHAFVVPGGRARAVHEEVRRASSLAVAALTPTLVVGLGFLLYVGFELL